MWRLVKAFGNFYLYSSLHIALCSALFTLETYVQLRADYVVHYLLFIFFSTICVYSLHRIIGMKKVEAFENEGRYKVIKQFKHHILLYFIIGGIASFALLMMIGIELLKWLVVPLVLTLLYILPLFKGKKRLRDFPFLKIFLIGIVWAWLCYAVPILLSDQAINGLMFLERVLFVIAITIPFDLRDKTVDESIGVKTLIHGLGTRNSKLLSIGLLFCCFGIIMFQNDTMEASMVLGLGSTYLLTIGLVAAAREDIGDWYYGGLMDALLGLRIILVIAVSTFLN